VRDWEYGQQGRQGKRSRKTLNRKARLKLGLKTIPPTRRTEMTKAQKISLATILVAIVLTLFAVYIWPTRYRYDEISAGQYAVYLRIDRFTGEVSRLDMRTNTWITTKMLAEQEAEREKQGRINELIRLGLITPTPTPTPDNIFESYIRERQNQQPKK
jgi:hypothetical protein